MLSETMMLGIINAAIMAPSADNMQPWKFSFHENTLSLFLDRELMGLFFDPSDVATKISCGAVIENIEQYACSLGLSTSLELDWQNHDHRIAQITFCNAGKRKFDDGIVEALSKRCTDRNLYHRRKRIPESVLRELEKSVAASSGYQLTRYELGDSRKHIINVVVAADVIRFSHLQTHKDFYDVLRFGTSGQERRDGLSEETLGIEPFFIPVLRMLRPWKLTRILNKVGLHHLMALRGSWLPLMYSSHIVSIVYQGSEDFISAGGVMEKFWIAATRAGLSVQPLGAFPLFLARIQYMRGEGFSSKQIDKLNSMEEEFSNITPPYISGRSRLIMLFRIGYSRKTPGRSLRRPLESFLI